MLRILALVSLALAASCSSPQADAWSQLLQVEDRFSVYLHETGDAEDGDLRTLRLIYVYGDGQIEWEGAEVSWQEYPAMTIDCASNYVVLGSRLRYAPDGSVVFSDDKPEARLIAPGTLTEIAATARCEGLYPSDTHSIADSPGWMHEARQRLSAWIETRSL